MKNVPFKVKAKYLFDNLLSQGTGALIAWLALGALLVIVIFSLLQLALGAHPVNDNNFTIGHALWANLTHMLDPGTLGDSVDTWQFQTFMIMVTLVGVVVLSTLIGLISNGILTKLEELRKGRSFVIEKDHVLILGWSSKIFTIISELVIANENQKTGTVVILADRDKVDMEDEIRDKVGSTQNTKVICRTGNPIDVHDLYIANPFDTKSIIILGKDNENSDSQIIKTIVAIVTNPDRRAEPYHITAEMTDKKNFDVAKMVGGDEVELILSDEIISRIMVQTSRQSGLSVVYQELMDFDGDEIYFTDEKKMVGKTFKEALFSYEESAVMGLQYADGSVEVNPPMDKVIRPGDRIIGITEDDDTLIPAEDDHHIKINKSALVLTDRDEVDSEKILIIGWNDRAKHIIEELDYYVAEGSIVDVYSKFGDAIKIVDKLQDSLSNIDLEFEIMDTTDRESIEIMNMHEYDYIILLCYQNYLAIQEADAQTLITLLHVRNISERDNIKFNMVSEMLDIRNRQLADITSANDFIVSDKLVSLLMSQVSENKYLMRVFEDLFDADGSEIYIKPAREYVKIDTPVNFYTVLTSAAEKNQVAIGYRIMSQARNASEGYGVVVNPKKSDIITLTEEDTVIVLSED
ncbi:MAG: potassium transporter TrkA [Bacteroidota bacterium]